jgi:restriction system protein
MKRFWWHKLSNRHWSHSAVAFACIVVLANIAARMAQGSPLHGIMELVDTYSPYLGLPFVLSGLAAYARQCRQASLMDRIKKIGDLWSMSWRDLEHLTAAMYRAEGYDVELVGGSGPDGGIDLILRRDRSTILVQCKHWRRRRVGVAIVRELRGVMAQHQAAAGVIVTCGTFTKEAEAFAGEVAIELVGGVELTERLSGFARQEALHSVGLRYNG